MTAGHFMREAYFIIIFPFRLNKNNYLQPQIFLLHKW